MSPTRRWETIFLLGIAVVIAVLGARPYAGAWNDGSRLAAVESLVDHATFSIDDSIFVRIPLEKSPYDPAVSGPHLTGTLDKLRIHGRYYSDKSPVPSVLLGSAYLGLQRVTGLRAADSPAEFCWWMNLLGGGLPFVAGVYAMLGIARELNLPSRSTVLWILSFTLATVAAAYSRHANNHIMQLAAVALLIDAMLRVNRRPTLTNWLAAGSLAGISYTIDLGLGPPILASVGLWAIVRCLNAPRRIGVVWFTLAALPWVLGHHVLNYFIAGTIGPANARPEYLTWPGSPFDVTTMTGRLQHTNIGWLILYGTDLLVGQRGILGNNLPLYLAVAGLPIVWRSRCANRSVLVASLAWCVIGFLAYAITSNNYAGVCLSIRWFVPMLAPAYLLLAMRLKQHPSVTRELVVLSAISAIWATAGWIHGPWARPPLALYWATMGTGLSIWGWRVWRQKSREVHHLSLQLWRRPTNNKQSDMNHSTFGELPHGTAEKSRRTVR